MRDDGRLSSDDERRGYSPWACVTSLRQRADLLADASATQHGKCKTVLATRLSGLGAGEPLLRDSVADRRLCMKSVMHRI